MNIASIFTFNKLKPIWSFSTGNTLWRVMFSENGLIFGEDRNIENKSVTFFCLDAKNGKQLWLNDHLEERWWIGLDAVVKNRLYLHGFRKPDMPEHKNIITVDAQTGNLLWQNPDCTFLAIRSPFVFGYKDLFERRVYYRIDENSGSILEELDSLPEDIEPNLQYEKTDFTFPQQFTVHDAQIGFVEVEPEGFKHGEYIATEKYTILNVYTHEAQDALKNTLSIIDSTTKKKVYSDVLNESTPYPVPDSFFLDKNRLYYIKERKTFVALDLKK